MDDDANMEKLFGVDDSGTIASRHIHNLLRLAWTGGIPTDGLRGLCWRVLLGLVSASDKSLWNGELSKMIEEYQVIRSKVLPSLDKVEVDPLSQLSEGTESEKEAWNIYYKNVDLINFIRTDLDRLYISGIPDEHFESPQRRDMLLAVLLIWSYQHPVISYRQGMHEVAGYVMYCVEQELAAWNAARESAEAAGKPVKDEFGLLKVFTEQNVEAHTFHIYARIMNELEPIYDPVSFTPRGAESQPFVVQYSMKVQEHYLRMLDSELCMHLEECHISAQIYGLRWSRVLLGREFTVQDSQIYKIWDYIFGCCYEAENSPADALLDADVRPNIISVLAAVRIAGHNRHSNEERRNFTSMGTAKHESPNESSAPSMPQYVCTPLLGALGDVMLAMMLNIRDQLLDGDSSVVLGLLMHYPDMPTVTPVLDYADMIKRGVIMGPERKPSKTGALKKQNVPLRIHHGGGGWGSQNSSNSNNSASPSPSPATGGGGWNLQAMKQKLTQVTLAASNAFSEIVSNLAEYGEDDAPGQGGSVAHPRQSGSSKGHSAAAVAGAIVDHRGIDDSNVRLVVKSDTGYTKATAAGAKVASNAKDVPKPDPKPPAAPIDSQEPEEARSETPSEAAAVVETDPLSGVLGPSNVGSAAAAVSGSAAGPVPPPRSPLLTGKGTGYKNMPAEAIPPPSEDAANGSTANQADLQSPTITGYHIRNKIFKNGWFPGSTAKKEKRGLKKNRSSGGVDLHILHSSMKQNPGDGEGVDSSTGDEEDSDTQNSELKPVGRHGRSVADAVDRNAVGDRLLDLADTLVHPPYTSLSPTLTSGRELDYEVEMRRDTVRKLRAIADVLAGLMTIDAYDEKFGQAVLTTESRPALGAAPLTPRRSPLPPTTMSPLPPVPEERPSVGAASLSTGPSAENLVAEDSVAGQSTAEARETGAVVAREADDEAHTEAEGHAAASVVEPAGTPPDRESLSVRASEGVATLHEEGALLASISLEDDAP